MIPIQNLYYLLCYAWNRLPEQEPWLAAEATTFHRPLELLGQVLLSGTRRLLRQGLRQAYAEREKELGELRGRVLLDASLSRDLLRRGRAVCAYDELGPDTPFLRVLLGTLEQLSKAQQVPAALRQELRAVRRHFPTDLPPTPLNSHALRAVRRTRPTGHEALLLNVCELIHRSALPEPAADGRTRFVDFRRDERLMAQLFEAFVRNFYRLEQRRFRVLSETISWQAAAEEPDDLSLLPAMITDTTLEAPDRKIILDTKYYRAALRPRYDRQRLISPHLYQLYAYLQNQNSPPSQQLEGVLLYPAATREVDLRYTLGGHPVRVVTLDLNQPWPGIAADLLKLIE
ncbi:5-methylcytosine restriction system specificity protein McrC [Hymenobacter sp. HD11105]